MIHNSKTVHLALAVNEAVILTTHLAEFLSGSKGRIQRLTNRKYELLDIILFAKFGFKSSITLGFQRLKPYFTNNHWRIVKDIMEINFKVRKMEDSNLCLNKVNEEVHYLIGMENYTSYEAYQVYEEQKWMQLGAKYIEWGAVQTPDELRDIIADLFETCEKR